MLGLSLNTTNVIFTRVQHEGFDFQNSPLTLKQELVSFLDLSVLLELDVMDYDEDDHGFAVCL